MYQNSSIGLMTNKLLKGVFAKRSYCNFNFMETILSFAIHVITWVRSESNGRNVTGNDFFPPTQILRSLCLIKCIKNAWLSHMVLSK